MLTVFALIQSGVNLVLVAILFLLMRERALAARRATTREDRLEALAAEFCALGRAVAGEEGRPAVQEAPVSAPVVPSAVPEVVAAPAVEKASADTARADATDRFKEAATFLDQGLPPATVVANTAILDGEVQVLNNLRRSQKPAGVRPRRPPAARKRQVVGNA